MGQPPTITHKLSMFTYTFSRKLKTVKKGWYSTHQYRLYVHRHNKQLQFSSHTAFVTGKHQLCGSSE